MERYLPRTDLAFRQVVKTSVKPSLALLRTTHIGLPQYFIFPSQQNR